MPKTSASLSPRMSRDRSKDGRRNITTSASPRRRRHRSTDSVISRQVSELLAKTRDLEKAMGRIERPMRKVPRLKQEGIRY